ncbi:MAG: pentapeptide repeat-containing protein [Balneola sp.]
MTKKNIYKIESDFIDGRVTNCQIFTPLNFSFDIFDHDIIFSNCIFEEEVNFSNCIFNKRVFFINCEFNSKVDFSYSKFNGFCSFADSIFRHSCLFTSTYALSLMNYSDVKFESTSTIDFHCSHFEKFANLVDVQINYNNLHKDYRRENARILKHYCINTNDKVMSFLFHKFEMKATLAKTKKSSDKIILRLNQISSDFGTDWVKAFLFTLVVSIMTFMFFYNFGLANRVFEWGWVSWESYILVIVESIKHFCIFINPAHSINDFNGLELNSLGYLIDLFARIFIGYGIYQLIVSSRVFSRNI